MALSSAQRRTLTKAFAARKPTPGGEAERQWRDDPGANWAPPKPRTRPRPIPNAKRRKPIPIPNTLPMGKQSGRYT